jgi:hypothetical protein
VTAVGGLTDDVLDDGLSVCLCAYVCVPRVYACARLCVCVYVGVVCVYIMGVVRVCACQPPLCMCVYQPPLCISACECTETSSLYLCGCRNPTRKSIV